MKNREEIEQARVETIQALRELRELRDKFLRAFTVVSQSGYYYPIDILVYSMEPAAKEYSAAWLKLITSLERLDVLEEWGIRNSDRAET